MAFLGSSSPGFPQLLEAGFPASLFGLSLSSCLEAVHSALSCLMGVTALHILVFEFVRERGYLSLFMRGTISASSCAGSIWIS